MIRRHEGRRNSLSVTTLACVATWVALWPMDEVVAAAPGEINFQGLLLDSGGAVVNGLVDLDFELFDAVSAGNSLWSESQSNVSVLDGVYDVALGSITPIGAAVLAGGSVWLEITVEGETLTPRQRLLAVPYALRSAESDHATSADTAGNLPLGTLEEIFATFPFDGAAPPNDDPSEGLADVDNDGIANFIDPDNDNDGILDGDEIQQGSDINLVTPTISDTAPSIASDIFSTPVAVTGTNFIGPLTVQVGSQTPTPTSITPTSFDIVLDAQPAPPTTSLTVTLSNGEQASSPFNFDLTVPSITSITPSVFEFNELASVDVVGTDFLGAFDVTLDGSPIAPSSVTTTSFTIDFTAPASSATLPIVVTLSNGQSANALVIVGPRRVFVTSTTYDGSLGGISGANALCAVRAAAGSLTGNYLAWLGDSTGSPSTNFTPSAFPYTLVDGTVVANDYADLTDGSLQVSISTNEFGSAVAASPVWSSVKSDGTAEGSTDCSDWSSTSGPGFTGSSSSAGNLWTRKITFSCATPQRLYCFPQ